LFNQNIILELFLNNPVSAPKQHLTSPAISVFDQASFTSSNSN